MIEEVDLSELSAEIRERRIAYIQMYRREWEELHGAVLVEDYFDQWEAHYAAWTPLLPRSGRDILYLRICSALNIPPDPLL